MLIDLYDLLQEEDGVRNYPVELEAKEFKTKKSRYPILTVILSCLLEIRVRSILILNALGRLH